MCKSTERFVDANAVASASQLAYQCLDYMHTIYHVTLLRWKTTHS